MGVEQGREGGARLATCLTLSLSQPQLQYLAISGWVAMVRSVESGSAVWLREHAGWGILTGKRADGSIGIE